ncbi:MAG TPA: CRISPR-associated helicase Cas3' [Armatimonadota bacterium]|nr:CRISPR-associated helicase Cas3' [Armatimonadota bacterium]
MDILLFWGKTGQDGQYHPLLYHLLDVAAVSRHLLLDALSPRIRQRIVDLLGLSQQSAIAPSVIAYLVGLHDIGKCIPGFQAKCSQLSAMLPESMAIPLNTRTDVKHGVFSAHEILTSAGDLQCIVSMDSSSANILGRIVGGHHGIFPRPDEFADLGPRALGSPAWRSMRRQLAAELARLLDITESVSVSAAQDAAVVPLLAGLVTVADWIGSSEMFPPVGPITTGQYVQRSKSQASQALYRFGWLPPLQPAAPAEFQEIFHFAPNTLQCAVMDIVCHQHDPYLIIIEGPMGIGKTEAALSAADYNLTHGISGGFFIGLPTQATTNAMYQRVRDDYLHTRGHGGILDMQLIHSHAGMIGNHETFGDHLSADDDEAKAAHVTACQWFQGRKRSLLSPFGVGTIDQALMAVLQTRHWFVRMFGLAGKTVIIDEVHAYDTYMGTILDRLLGWLAAIDCSVILLSATLPQRRRHELVHAYGGTIQDAQQKECYPRLTVVARDENSEMRVTVKDVPHDGCPHKRIRLAMLPTDVGSWSSKLAADLADRGCAVIICNTVNRAQEIFQALTQDGVRLPETDYFLFHARMPYGMREACEMDVLERFGKKFAGTPERYARRAVLVATQVVEQSLDLDFDWMASEMAPIDLILQRLGRLHRHRANDEYPRPVHLRLPTLHLLCDADPASTPPLTFGDCEYIYDRYILLRTLLSLRNKDTINVPDDIDELIGDIYEGTSTPDDIDWQQALQESLSAHEMATATAQKKAESIVIQSPRAPKFLLSAFNADLADDDDPSSNRALRAATRDGRPSITVICLCGDNDVWSPWGSDITVDLRQQPDHETTLALLRAALPLSQPQIYATLCTAESPKGWRDHAHLRHARAVCFRHGIAEIGQYRLTLDNTLGLIIARKEDVDDIELQPD